MTITRAQFSALLEPTLRDIKSDPMYPRRPMIGLSFYNVLTSKKAKETDFQWAGLGTFQVKNEGGPVTFSDPIPGPTLIYTHVRRALGYQITQEMLDHDLYQEIRKMEQALQIAGDDDIEIGAHLLLNNAFTTAQGYGGAFVATGFDGLQLCSTAHTRLDGGATQPNRPSTDVNLDWTALANGVTTFMSWKDERGRPIMAVPRRLIIHIGDVMTAKELVGSLGKPGTANNEINALRDWSMDLVVSQYLTGNSAWFLQGDYVDSKFYWDVTPRTSSEDDWEKEIIMRKRVQGWSNGHGDWRAWYGTSATG